jgi:nucleolar complex protein 3
MCKRLLGAALHWPGAAALQALEFAAGMVAREPQLEALFASEDRRADGVYRPEAADPQLANAFASSAFEVFLLARDHADARVRAAAVRLAAQPGKD